MHRAYSVLHVKAFDVERRTIRGIATTPTPDRHDDVLDPLGATFAPEVPLLLHHRKETPVGVARLEPPTKDGITFVAELPIIAEPGPVKDEVDRAWTSLQHGLIRGASIGFRPVGERSIEPRTSGGMHFRKTEILEVSLVTVPANRETTLAIVKEFDRPHLAALGRHPSGVSDPRPIRGEAMTLQEQITQFENTRASHTAQMSDLMTKAAADNTTLSAEDAAAYDDFESRVKAIDDHLRRLHQQERLEAARATPIAPVPEIKPASELRGGVIQVKSMVPKGTAFVRYCQAIAFGRGDTHRTLEFAKQWKDSTPEVEMVLKAAVAVGTTTDTNWAAPLVPLQPMASEFLELLRPATILGKIPGLHRVPFNISVPVQTAGGTYAWVGQGAPKPVSALAFSTVTLGISKAAGIIVITQELARFSSPSAEDAIRSDMIAGMAQFLDLEFTDPAKAAVTNVSPGSVTNGVTPITSSGTTPANARTDIVALLSAITAANLSVRGAVVIMSETNALALASSLNPLGQPLFPSLNLDGGTVQGVSVITSQAVGTKVIALVPSAIYLADDGGVNIDMSTEASVQMNDAPDNPAVATTVYRSFWQDNLVGLRAERFINWKKVRTGSVQYTSSTYVAGTAAAMEAGAESAHEDKPARESKRER